MEKLPHDRKIFYITLFNVNPSADEAMIFDALGNTDIIKIFPVEDIPNAYDIQFFDRQEVYRTLEMREKAIDGVEFEIKLSRLTRQETLIQLPSQQQEERLPPQKVF